jgi:uncharacterized protein (DUF1330 family)
MAVYLEATQESGRALFTRGINGSVVMLNLLRFRKIADYSAAPQLAPQMPISGEAAYRRYMDLTMPHLEKSGGKVLFLAKGGSFFIGPSDEKWDAAILVQQSSLKSFLEFASNPEYMAGVRHRTAALEDSRLLPLVEASIDEVFPKA